MAKTKTARTSDMKRSLPFLLCFGGLIVLLIAVVSWMPSKRLTDMCAPGSLKLTAGQPSGAAGTIYQPFKVENASKKSCKVSGYPTVFLYGSDGYALGNAAAPTAQPAPTSITLGPGEAAHTTVGFPQAGNFDPGVCSANKSTSIRVFMPGAVASLELPLENYWCPGFSSSAMQAGS